MHKKKNQEAEAIIKSAFDFLIECRKMEKETLSAALRRAEQGDAQAQAEAGEGYLFGSGSVKDLEKALFWLRQSAEQNNAQGQYWLGYCFAYGEGVAQDLHQALYWMDKSRKQGYDEAQELSEALDKFLQLEREADDGSTEALFALGKHYVDPQRILPSVMPFVQKDKKKGFVLLRSAAEKGHAGAQYEVAELYWYGDYENKIERNTDEAKLFYCKAAEQGHIRAQVQVGKQYQQGRWPFAKDETLAAEWFATAAEQGDAEAQYLLGLCHALGQGAEKNDTRALSWICKAHEQGYWEAGNWLTDYHEKHELMEKAEKGDADLAYRLGMRYLDSHYAPADKEKALYWLTQAADAGHAEAICEVSQLIRYHEPEISLEYLKKAISKKHLRAKYLLAEHFGRAASAWGKPVSERSECDYFYYSWMKKAAEQGYELAKNKMQEQVHNHFLLLVDNYPAAKAGDAQAQYRLGDYYLRHHPYSGRAERAFYWFGLAAAQGVAEAQYALVGFYRGNHWGVDKDEAQALHFLQSAAELGFLPAQRELIKYFAAQGEEEQALVWEEKMADSGDIEAVFTIGERLFTGRGVAQDKGKAARYFVQAANHGHAGAQFRLAECCAQGYGMEKNDKQALVLLQKSAAQSYADAQLALAQRYMQKENAAYQAQAFRLCREAALQALPEAQFLLAQWYTHGRGVAQDTHLAAVWLAQAATLGHQDAQQQLAQAYQSGVGVARNTALADYWQNQAAHVQGA